MREISASDDREHLQSLDLYRLEGCVVCQLINCLFFNPECLGGIQHQECIYGRCHLCRNLGREGIVQLQVVSRVWSTVELSLLLEKNFVH